MRRLLVCIVAMSAGFFPAAAQIVDTGSLLKYDVYSQTSDGTRVYAGSTYVAGLTYTWPVYDSQLTGLITGPGVYATLQSVSPSGLSAATTGPLFRTRGDLDAQVANGVFRFQITFPADATFDGSITLSGNNYPPVPEITNFDALQQVAGGTASLQWNVPGGQASDFVIASIADANGEVLSSTPDVSEAGALNGGSRNAALLVPPGMNLVGNVMAVRVATLRTVDGVDLVGGYGTVTAFPIRTAGVPDTAPPVIVGRTPAEGAFGVDPQTEVEITFDKPMRLRGDVSSTAFPADFFRSSNTWSADQRTVRMHWPKPLPPGPVTLLANTSQGLGAPVQFVDLSGNAWPGGEVVSFFVGKLPAFVSQPLDTTVRPGESLQLTADVRWPGAALSLQWYKDGVPVPGATEAAFHASAFSAADAGVYELQATNEFGDSRSAKVLVLPDMQAALRNSVSIGAMGSNSTSRLLVPPSGRIAATASFLPVNSSYTLQWRRDGAPIAGATASSLTIEPAQTADTGVYDLLVTNSYGSIASAPMEVIVTTDIPLPEITPQVSTQIFDAGDTRLLVAPDLSNTTVLRFWRLNGVAIPGATNSSYQVQSLSPANAGVYQFVAANGREEKVLVETNVMIRSGAPVVGKPLVSASGANYFSEGGGFFLTASAEGVTPLTYQWQREGVDIPGATDSTYFRWPADLDEAGTYRCVVSNALGSMASESVTIKFLSKLVPPEIPVISGASTTLAGETINLSCTYISRPQPSGTIQWFRDGAPIQYATNAILQVPKAKVSDSGDYSVALTNPYGTSVSEPFHVSIIDDSSPPVVKAGPLTLRLGAGDKLELSAPVVATPSATYRWFLDGVPVTSAVTYLNQSPALFTAPSVQLRDAGTYTVCVSNSVGSVEAPVAMVTVDAPPVISGTHLTNLSTRATAGRGDRTLIAGFAIGGEGRKRLLIRGVGSGLSSWVQQSARDARITLFRQGTPLSFNAVWLDQPGVAQLAMTSQLLGAFALSPRGDDAAMIVELDPGAYTVQVQADAAANGSDGIALAEVYDADPGYSTARLTNLSTRAFVGSGDQVAIPGLVITGSSPKTYLFRVVGPKLTAYGVNGVLADPQLALQETNLGVFLRNDDWGMNRDVDELVSTTERVGAFALDPGSKDAALLATLKPGVYTVLATGAATSSGVALIEIYEVP